MSAAFEAVVVALEHPSVREALGPVTDPARTVWLDSSGAVETYVAARPVALVVLPADSPEEEVGRIRDRQRRQALHGQLLSVGPEGAARGLEEMDPWSGPDAPPPPPADDVQEVVEALIEFARVGQLTGLVGESAAIRAVLRTVSRIAPTDVPVLIQGPSGTGKELVARGIHRASPRDPQPFMAVNTPGLSESLIESELFGHERGAFTGAATRKEGVFEAAGEGTIFLDEIGDLSRGLQAKLLRVLEQHEFTRVGGTQTVRVAARVVAATNVDLETAVADGSFREDLYFRLKVVTIEVPPLRERREDIRPLLHHFVREVCRDQDTTFQGFTEDAVRFLIEYRWPGNVRELRNLVEQVVLLHPERKIDAVRLERILRERHRDLRHLPAPTGKSPEQAEREMIFRSLQALTETVGGLRADLDEMTGRRGAPAWSVRPGQGRMDEGTLSGTISVPLGQPLEEIELRLIEETLERLGGDKRRTAEVLGIGLRTLYRRLERLEARRGEREPDSGAGVDTE